MFVASDYIRKAGFRMCWCKTSDMRIEKHLVGQKMLVRYMEDTDSDILGVRVFNNFVNNVDIEPWSRILCSRHPITSDWRVFRMCWWQRSDHDNRKTSDWSKSDCSVRGRYQQRYLVYYKKVSKWIFAETYMEWACIFRRDLSRVLQETLKL